MSENVVPFRRVEEKEENGEKALSKAANTDSLIVDSDPHWSGEARCIGCSHRWAAVAPVGTRWLECRNCGNMLGTPYHAIEASPGDLEYTCGCGGIAMTAIEREGFFFLLCMTCGQDKTDAMFGERK